MTKEEITNGNKLIAEFMGYKYYPYESPEDPSQQPPKYKSPFSWGWIKGDPNIAGLQQKHPRKDHHWLCRSHRDLRYFNEWDWLIPVCQRISAMGCIVQITFCLAGSCKIWNRKGGWVVCESNSPIEAVYNTVVRFIECHETPAIAIVAGAKQGE